MFLKNIKITNYKNLSDVELSFSSKIFGLTGLNGAGKTNFLDSIYFIANTRSYFYKSDAQNIRKGENFFYISANFKTNSGKIPVSASFSENKKVFKVEDKRVKKFSDYYGKFPVIFITPNDTELILNGSEIRRSFIDSVISIYNKEYLNALVYYKKTLEQRNSLLKKFSISKTYNKEFLDIYNEKLSKYAPVIFEARKAFINEFLPLFQYYYQSIANTAEKAEIIYESHLFDSDIANLLAENEEKDRVLARTTHGVHKDELVLKLDGRLLRKTGSQGQQKSFLIAMKFAKSDFLKNHTGFKPILLLDDLFDKLDAERISKVVKLVSDDKFGQIFITHTNKNRLNEILSNIKTDFSIFEIENGTFFRKIA